MKVVKDELLDNRMEESGDFIDLGRQADYDKIQGLPKIRQVPEGR